MEKVTIELNTMSEKKYIELKIRFDKLDKEFEQYKKRSIEWCIEDFLDYDTDGKYIITKGQAQEALEEMIKKHDPSLGITWDTVDYYLKEYGTETENLEIIL